ncbi:hypothetical protein [Flammeovirga sp. SJP92]|uniref:hypothetical protein n=1 Tax=Flammeovirga sp. SJP92 TaxID=1775430 RepID=UPI0007888B11|nr:hypothetical protein [Flammeovirga sp. SJP92]KXX66866.1 hypothetical protein AVL50_30510 [Flammeovirga sp. SJP92]
MGDLETTIQNFNQQFPNCLQSKISLSKYKREEITLFLDKYAFLKMKKKYVDFLSTFSGVSYFNQKSNEDFTLYGFNYNGICFNDNEYFQEPLVDANGYFLFGHLFQLEENIFIDFVFKIEDNLTIYAREKILPEGIKYTFLCNEIDELLQKVLSNEIIAK